MKNLKILIHSFSIFFALGITPITKVLAEGTEAISNPQSQHISNKSLHRGRNTFQNQLWKWRIHQN